MNGSLDILEQHIPRCDASTPSVSAWTVGMQLHHALLASAGIAEALGRSEPGARKPDRSIVRSVILLTGRIPRGRGRAPEPSLPSQEITQSELRDLLARARSALGEAEHLPPNAWWDHPRFGVMHRDTAVRFLHLHNRHHLAIVRDILKRHTASG